MSQESAEEIKRYYCSITHISEEEGIVFVDILDSTNIIKKSVGLMTVELLREHDVNVHLYKNFHIVIYGDGSYKLFWVNDRQLDIKRKGKIEKCLKEIFIKSTLEL